MMCTVLEKFCNSGGLGSLGSLLLYSWSELEHNLINHMNPGSSLH